MRFYIVRATTPGPIAEVSESYFVAEHLANDQVRELKQLGWPVELTPIGHEIQYQFLGQAECGDTGVLKP